MIDSVSIHIKSGKGGDGAVSGRREKFVPFGGPDGGDGGDGGSVYLFTDSNLNTLMGFRYRRRFAADAGGAGAGELRYGKKGADVEIGVPVGTQVSVDESARPMFDMDEAGVRVCLVMGGRGGRGNARFASSTNRFPLLAQEGELGRELTVKLELKLLADVGIVGAPNAGKSSLLAAVTAARPKIAGYPFTTLEPVLGVADWRGNSFVMVDIPGLVEGAHRGVGLGQEFLRHIERTRVLVHVLDMSDEGAEERYRQTNQELELFNLDVAARRQVVALNKIDIPGAQSRAAHWERELRKDGQPAVSVSAASHEGLADLLDSVSEALNAARQEREQVQDQPPVDALPVLRPRPRAKAPKVRRRNGVFVVDVSAATRIAAKLDERNWAARTQFFLHLQRMGVIKALEEAGVSSGDTVRVGKLEWEWE